MSKKKKQEKSGRGVKWLALILAALATMVVGGKRCRKNGETLYRFSVLGFPDKDPVSLYVHEIAKANGWGIAEYLDCGEHLENGGDTLIFFLLFAEEEQIKNLAEDLQARWPMLSISYVKEEKNFRKIMRSK